MNAREQVLEMPLHTYLLQLSSTAAVPGGGSAAAIAGAMGSALGSMVCKLSARKTSDATLQAELGAMAAEFEAFMNRLAQLSQEDIDAYRAVIAVRKEPTDRPERADALARAFETAARVPLETATLSRRCLDLLARLRPNAWDMVSSDLETAGHLLQTALEGGLANVVINLPELSPPSRMAMEREISSLRASAPG